MKEPGSSQTGRPASVDRLDGSDYTNVPTLQKGHLMANHRAETRMVKAVDVRDWLLWLSEHYDPNQDTPENTEIRRLGQTLDALGRLAGAIDTTDMNAGVGSCLLVTFDWEHGEIEFFRPHLLKNRLGSADPDDLITRLVMVTGIPEQIPEVPPEPEYVV